MDAETEQLLVDLQSRLAFQDDAIQALNRTVAQQQRVLDALLRELTELRRQLRALTPEGSPGTGEEPPPPHY